MSVTLLWHDYESFGKSGRTCRPAQFAALRTDADLNTIEEPINIYCKPSPDFVPSPMASLVTGITPQHAFQLGSNESDFIKSIQQQISRHGTCTVGYNNIKFDDELTRQLLYRNFYDPYAHTYLNNCSRWDIIGVARFAAALRPDGIVWPRDELEPHKPSFSLSKITEANNIQHDNAHDAMFDVLATINFAKLLKSQQPRLYEHAFSLRLKNTASTLVKPGQPILHVATHYSPENQYCALVIPIFNNPRDRNAWFTLNLTTDISQILDTDDLKNLNIPFYGRIKINASPMIAETKNLRPQDYERLNINKNTCEQSYRLYQKFAHQFNQKIKQFVEQKIDYPPEQDVDFQLYDGSFFSDHDKKQMDIIRSLAPHQLDSHSFDFQDARLPEMLFRYKARNWPDILNEADQKRWTTFIESRWSEQAKIEYTKEIGTLKNNAQFSDERSQEILTEMLDYVRFVEQQKENCFTAESCSSLPSS
jgi:exodeoxyribonuclease-1